MFWDGFKKWTAKPFSEDMPALHWFLLIGFVLVCALAWRIILAHLFTAVSAVTPD